MVDPVVCLNGRLPGVNGRARVGAFVLRGLEIGHGKNEKTDARIAPGT
jgi:hypothetical protein